MSDILHLVPHSNIIRKKNKDNLRHGIQMFSYLKLNTIHYYRKFNKTFKFFVRKKHLPTLLIAKFWSYTFNF